MSEEQKHRAMEAVVATRGQFLLSKSNVMLTVSAPGRLRTCCQRILINLTYSAKEVTDKLRIIGILPLAYGSCMRLPTPGEADTFLEEMWTRFERGHEAYYVVGDGHSGVALESDSVLGRLLFLLLLTKGLEICGGSLEEVPSLLKQMPELHHLMKQATTLTVIEKIVRATVKRHLTDGLSMANSYLAEGELMRARWKFLSTAELASIVVDFEQNPWFQQRWKQPVSGGLALSYSLLQGASGVCELLELPLESAALDEVTEKDRRYGQMNLATLSEAFRK